MMLATNKEMKSKEDVIKVARTYFSRWKIEEYFRRKKQMFQFENFRVRKHKKSLCLTITEKNSKILKLPRKNVSKPKVLFTKIVEGKKRYYENKAKTLVKEEYRLDVRNVFSLSGDDCPGR